MLRLAMCCRVSHGDVSLNVKIGCVFAGQVMEMLV